MGSLQINFGRLACPPLVYLNSCMVMLHCPSRLLYRIGGSILAILDGPELIANR